MKPLKLNSFEKDNLRLLYMAKRAPVSELERPELHPEDGVVDIYHSEIASVFEQMQLTFYSSNNLDDLVRQAHSTNFVFSIFNRCGFKGSEVFVSTMCEYLNIDYLGAAPHIRAIAEDKHLMKLIACSLDIPTPLWYIVRSESSSISPPEFGGPYFVKPRCGASSEYISQQSLQESWSDTIPQIAKITGNGLDAIVEEYIPGINITLPVIGHSQPWMLPCCITRSSIEGDIVTYYQKRLLEGGIKREIYADKWFREESQSIALKLYEHLRPIDYFRIDFRLNEHTGKLYFLELNVCCNLGTHSTIVIPALQIGLSQEELIEHIITFSIRRQNTIRK